MRFLPRCVHTVTLLVTVFLFGAVIFFAVASVGLHFSSYDTAVEWITRALFWFLVLLCVWGIWKKVPYALLLPSLVVSGGLVTYLAYDDPVRLPPPDLGQIVPADSKSYEAYRWFLREDPHSRVPSWRDVPELPRFPEDRAKWPSFFTKNREVFVKAWADDTVGRGWIEAMAASAPEGIYPLPARTDQPLLSFASFRYTAAVHWGYAEVLMLDGKEDEAAALLLTLLRANYHLQRGGFFLVTEMVALVGVKGTYDQLGRLIKSGRLSPQSRAAIAAALIDAPPLQLVFHHVFVGEEFMVHISIKTVVDSMVTAREGKILDTGLLSRLMFNPHRTERELVEFLHEARRLAERRQLESGKELGVEFAQRIDHWRIKNPAGQLLMQMMLPAFNTGVFWKGEDQRLALLHQLEPR